MKFALCLGFLLLLLVSVAQSYPALEEPLGAELAAVSRQKRATCDLLSAFNVNHSACALHCIAKRFKGGHCDGNAVCVCRH